MLPLSNPDRTNILLNAVQMKYPSLSFKPGLKFAFRPPKTIIFAPKSPNFNLLLLHELGHATLHHTTFATDIERLKMESQAWEQAKILAQSFNIPFDINFAQSELDSYRNWLHQKSLCKTCKLTRFQTPDGTYHCPRCGSNS